MSRLAQHFPFILRLLGRDSCQTSVAQRNDFHGNPYPSEDSDIEQLLNNNYYEVNDSRSDSCLLKIFITLACSIVSIFFPIKNKITLHFLDSSLYRETVKCGAGLSEVSTESSNFYDPNDEGIWPNLIIL